MWGWGPVVSGYCGEASLQSVALYYGNWLTQDAVRGTTGGYDGAHEVLLDNSSCSSVSVAAHFKLRTSEWKAWEVPQPQADAFLAWMKGAVDEGTPVVFGLYMTVYHSPTYDHIVPLVGYDDDSLYFNDLYFNQTLHASLRHVVKSRSQCWGVRKHSGAAEYCLPKKNNYGYRVLGNLDPSASCYPFA